MTGVLEVGAVGALTAVGASSLGIVFTGQSKPCFQGLFTRTPPHQVKKHYLDPPHHGVLSKDPLAKKDVRVKLGEASLGQRRLEFNGEILAISSSADANSSLAPAMALGACDVNVAGSKVVASPPTLPTIELKFSTAEEAQCWADEFTEASKRKPPPDRIQDLMLHSLQIDKYMKDLRERMSKVSILEQQSKKLKNILVKHRAGMDSPERRTSVGSALVSWMGHGAHDEEEGRLNMELERLMYEDEMEKMSKEHEKAKSLSRKMTASIVEHARTNPEIALNWRRMVNKKLQQVADREQQQLQQSGEVQENKRGRAEASSDVMSQPKVNQVMPLQDFQKRLEDAENQLAVSRQSFLEERLRANCTGNCSQSNVVSGSPLGEYTNTTFRILEERIRSHQLEVNQECDMLQQALQIQGYHSGA